MYLSYCCMYEARACDGIGSMEERSSSDSTSTALESMWQGSTR